MTDSLFIRFSVSLFANFMRSGVSFSAGLLVAQGLGPEHYGIMMFLLGTFGAVRQLIDSGSSSAFFTFLSRQERSQKFVLSFFVWLGLQFAVPFLFVAWLFPDELVDLIWKSDQRATVLMAFLASYAQSTLWSVVSQMAEAQRLTRRVQLASLSVTVFYFFAILIFFSFNFLTVELVFLLISLQWLTAVALVGVKLRYRQKWNAGESTRGIFYEFKDYCIPLIPYAWVSFLYEFADRWLLQEFGGAVEQAYYSVAFQFGAIASIATTSILNIFWKEIADSFHRNEKQQLEKLFNRVSRSMVFVASAVGCLLVPWSGEILTLMLDERYSDGQYALMLMLMYPIHQSLGQVSGAVAYATGLVGIYAKLGILMMGVSVAATYWVLADETGLIPGLGLGSKGLAFKMLFMQIISVSLLYHALSKKLSIKVEWSYQIFVPVFCLISSISAVWVSNLILPDASAWYTRFGVASLFFLVILVKFLVTHPNLAGLHRDDFERVAVSLRKLTNFH